MQNLHTIPVWRVQLALGFVADSLSKKPIAVWGKDKTTQRLRFAISTTKH